MVEVPVEAPAPATGVPAPAPTAPAKEAAATAPKGPGVSVTTVASGWSVEEFEANENKEEFIAAIAHAAVVPSSAVQILKVRTVSPRRSLLQSASPIEVISHINTQDVAETLKDFEAAISSGTLAEDLKTVGLTLIRATAVVAAPAPGEEPAKGPAKGPAQGPAAPKAAAPAAPMPSAPSPAGAAPAAGPGGAALTPSAPGPLPAHTVLLQAEVAGALSVEDFNLKDEQWIAAVAKAAGVTPSQVEVKSVKAKPGRRLLNGGPTLLVDTVIHTDDPIQIVQVLNQAIGPNGSLQADLDTTGLTLNSASVSIPEGPPKPKLPQPPSTAPSAQPPKAAPPTAAGPKAPAPGGAPAGAPAGGVPVAVSRGLPGGAAAGGPAGAGPVAGPVAGPAGAGPVAGPAGAGPVAGPAGAGPAASPAGEAPPAEAPAGAAPGPAPAAASAGVLLTTMLAGANSTTWADVQPAFRDALANVSGSTTKLPDIKVMGVSDLENGYLGDPVVQVKTLIESTTPEIVAKALQEASVDGDLAVAIKAANLTLLPGTDIQQNAEAAPPPASPPNSGTNVLMGFRNVSPEAFKDVEGKFRGVLSELSAVPGGLDQDHGHREPAATPTPSAGHPCHCGHGP
eukprot:jgi/Botrbrau1/19111/Bobra.0077s0024.1